MIPGLDVAGLLTSLGTTAITKAIDKIAETTQTPVSKTESKNSTNTTQPIIIQDSNNGKLDPLMRPINLTVNLNIYVDGELVKKMQLDKKEKIFLDRFKTA